MFIYVLMPPEPTPSMLLPRLLNDICCLGWILLLAFAFSPLFRTSTSSFKKIKKAVMWCSCVMNPILPLFASFLPLSMANHVNHPDWYWNPDSHIRKKNPVISRYFCFKWRIELLVFHVPRSYASSVLYWKLIDNAFFGRRSWTAGADSAQDLLS